MRHKNIVQFIGACTRKPNLCILFEYMSGGSLYDYIRREGPLKLTLVLKICLEVSRGMDYLHQRKIIHRDLKAANLLLDENGTVSTVVASLLQPTCLSHKYSNAGNALQCFCGTQGHMQPAMLMQRRLHTASAYFMPTS